MLLEPAASLTDLALSLLALVFAWRMSGYYRQYQRRVEGLWALSFLSLAVAGYIGFLVHGFPAVSHFEPAWFSIRLGIGVAVVLLVVASLFVVLGEQTGLRWSPYIILMLGIIFIITQGSEAFISVYGGFGMLSAVALFLTARQDKSPFMLLGGAIMGSVFFGLKLGVGYPWGLDSVTILHFAAIAALPCFFLAARPTEEPALVKNEP